MDLVEVSPPSFPQEIYEASSLELLQTLNGRVNEQMNQHKRLMNVSWRMRGQPDSNALP